MVRVDIDPALIGRPAPGDIKGHSFGLRKTLLPIIAVETTLILEACGPTQEQQIVIPQLNVEDFGLDQAGLAHLKEARDSFASNSKMGQIADVSFNPEVPSQNHKVEEIIAQNIMSRAPGVTVDSNQIDIKYDELAPVWMNIGTDKIDLMSLPIELQVEGDTETRTILFMFGRVSGGDWGQIAFFESPLPAPGPDGKLNLAGKIALDLDENPNPDVSGFWVSSVNQSGFSSIVEFKNVDEKLVLVETLPDGKQKFIPLEDNDLFKPTEQAPLPTAHNAMIAFNSAVVTPESPSISITPTASSETTNEIPPTPSVPMIEVDGLQIPDPKASNPELFDITNPDSPIVQFANAFGVKPEEVGNLTPKLLTGVDGKQFIVLTTGDLSATANFDETGIPLMIAEQKDGEWGWDESTLKDIAEKNGILAGSFFGGNNLGAGDFEKISDIMKKEFSLGGIWVGMSDIQPTEGNFNLVNLGLSQRGLASLYHPLIWFDSSPDWIRNKTGEDLSQSIITHVETVSKKIESNYQQSEPTDVPPIIIVINEANHSGDFYYEKLGFDYIRTAFQTARENAPSAQLIYNDYNNHLTTGDRYNNTKDIVDRLVAEGLIDGVGIELVLDGSSLPIKENLIETFKSYGLPAYITEFSVNMRNVSGSPEEKLIQQAEIYRIAMEACLESEVCPVFVDFQIGDKFSVWENNQFLPQFSVNADPTPFDDNLKPKMAFFAQLQALINHLSQ